MERGLWWWSYVVRCAEKRPVSTEEVKTHIERTAKTKARTKTTSDPRLQWPARRDGRRIEEMMLEMMNERLGLSSAEDGGGKDA